MKNIKTLFAFLLIVLFAGAVFSHSQRAYATNPLEELADQQLEEMQNQADNQPELSEEQIQQLRQLQQFTGGWLQEGMMTNPEGTQGLQNFYGNEVQDMYSKIFEEYDKQQAAKKAEAERKKKEAEKKEADKKKAEKKKQEDEAKKREQERQAEEKRKREEEENKTPAPVVASPPPAQPPAQPKNASHASPKVKPKAEAPKDETPEKEEKKTPKQRVTLVREESEKKFSVKILDNKQDANGDGASDEVEVLFSLDPKASFKGDFSAVEKKLYGVAALASEAELQAKCAIGLQQGAKLSSAGFIVLAACPKNKSFTLYAADKDGIKTAVQTKQSSENGKIIFAVDRAFALGEYVLQVKPASTSVFADLKAAILREDSAASQPIKVQVVEPGEIAQPRVQKIENVDVLRVRDIKINATQDGRIRVSGIADLGALVISTFESAIFTSALIADVEGGYFETISQKALSAGDHEVTVYASDLDLGIQSKSGKLSFKILPPMLVDTPEHGRTGQPLTGTRFPYIPVLGALGLAVLIVGTAFILKKKGQ